MAATPLRYWHGNSAADVSIVRHQVAPWHWEARTACLPVWDEARAQRAGMLRQRLEYSGGLCAFAPSCIVRWNCCFKKFSLERGVNWSS